MTQNIIATIGLFIGVWFGFINTSKIFVRQSISPANLIVMALGWTVFISGMWVF